MSTIDWNDDRDVLDIVNQHAQEVKREAAATSYQKLISNSVKNSTSKNVPVHRAKPRKKRKSSDVMMATIAFIGVISAGILGAEIWNKVDLSNRIDQAKTAITMEIQQDYLQTPMLPDTAEERQILYDNIAQKYELNLSNQQDRAFLFWAVAESVPAEKQEEAMKQALGDYGIYDIVDENTGQIRNAVSIMCAQYGYYDQETGRPSRAVFNNYQQARALKLAEDQDQNQNQSEAGRTK